MLLAYSTLLAVVRARLLVTINRFGIGRKDVGGWTIAHLCECWRGYDVLIGHESHILVYVDIDRRRRAVTAIGVSTIGTHVTILLEISDRLLNCLHLSNQFIGMHSLTFLRILCLIQTTDLWNKLLILNLALAVDLDLEELHPTDSSYGILRQHPRYQVLQKRRNWSRELQLLAIEHFN